MPQAATVPSFVEEDELNYAARVRRELEEAKRKSVQVDPNAKLPVIGEPPAPEPEKQKKKKRSKKAAKPEQPEPAPKHGIYSDEDELKLRAKETPDETKARVRASLLDDLPDVDAMPRRKSAPAPQQQPAAPPAAASAGEPDIPKIDANSTGELSDPNAAEDPFADIHWNNDQTTFTIRL